jgi:sugar lactone lactonase YvrE
METPDDASRSGADRMAVDSHGFVYIATRLGIQICDKEGRVVAILNGPEPQTGDFEGAVSGLAFGGPDMQYLYALVGHQVYRRHLVRMPIQP